MFIYAQSCFRIKSGDIQTNIIQNGFGNYYLINVHMPLRFDATFDTWPSDSELFPIYSNRRQLRIRLQIPNVPCSCLARQNCGLHSLNLSDWNFTD